MIKTPIATILFGDTSHQIIPDAIRTTTAWSLSCSLPIQQLFFQNQVHNNQGLAITNETRGSYTAHLMHDSDYLITNLPNIGIGVLTADCAPIALIDPRNAAIAMIHAGWRGTVGKIVVNTLAHMNNLYGTRPRDVLAYIGPCAHTCCYRIDQAFVNQLPGWAQAFVQDDRFDLVACNGALLRQAGIPNQQINLSTSTCTICNEKFLSHRRNSLNPARQPSIIWLN